MQPTELKEPEGISFYSIRTGETHYGKLEPTIAAYINSSDMGINASRGQDYGWRLAPEWVKKVREFKRDPIKMSIITSKNDGRKPTTTQILYYMYGEQLAAFYEQQEENESPFEEAYLRAINAGLPVRAAAEEAGMPTALADYRALDEEDDDLSDLIDDTILEDEEESNDNGDSNIPGGTTESATPPEQTQPTPDSSNKPADPPKADTTVKVDGGKVTAPKTDGKTSTAKPKNNQQK